MKDVFNILFKGAMMAVVFAALMHILIIIVCLLLGATHSESTLTIIKHFAGQTWGNGSIMLFVFCLWYGLGIACIKIKSYK